MLKAGLRIALLLCADLGGAGAVPGGADEGRSASCVAQAALEREVAELHRRVWALQSELLRTKTYGQAAPAADAAAASAGSALTAAAEAAAACEGPSPSDNSFLTTSSLASSASPSAVADRGRPLGNNASHTSAYRQCYLFPHTNKFTLPPSNFVLSKKGFIYFEIPKVGAGAASPRQGKRTTSCTSRIFWRAHAGMHVGADVSCAAFFSVWPGGVDSNSSAAEPHLRDCFRQGRHVVRYRAAVDVGAGPRARQLAPGRGAARLLQVHGRA